MTAIHVAHRTGARYTAPMNTPTITAALARKPRRNPRALHAPGGEGGLQTRSHNYLAEPAKKRAGAALGNRHAATGAAERVDRRRRMEALVQQTCALADAVNAAIYIGQLEHRRLVQLLAEAQDV